MIGRGGRCSRVGSNARTSGSRRNASRQLEWQQRNNSRGFVCLCGNRVWCCKKCDGGLSGTQRTGKFPKGKYMYMDAPQIGHGPFSPAALASEQNWTERNREAIVSAWPLLFLAPCRVGFRLSRSLLSSPFHPHPSRAVSLCRNVPIAVTVLPPHPAPLLQAQSVPPGRSK